MLIVSKKIPFKAKRSPRATSSNEISVKRKLEEIALRNANNGELWETTFAEHTSEERPTRRSQHNQQPDRELLRENGAGELSDNKVTVHLAVWCQTFAKVFCFQSARC